MRLEDMDHDEQFPEDREDSARKQQSTKLGDEEMESNAWKSGLTATSSFGGQYSVGFGQADHWHVFATTVNNLATSSTIVPAENNQHLVSERGRCAA